jgi:hypothetical protein
MELIMSEIVPVEVNDENCILCARSGGMCDRCRSNVASGMVL